MDWFSWSSIALSLMQFTIMTVNQPGPSWPDRLTEREIVMERIQIPYARDYQTIDIESASLIAIMVPAEFEMDNPCNQTGIIEDALNHPIGSSRLADLCAKSKHVLIITSDHTRPLPSAVTLPHLLREIRFNNPEVQIMILIATGFHRLTSSDEMIAKFGQDLIESEDFAIHDCQDTNHLIFKGYLPSGGELWLNDLVDWADLVVAEGFIEPHFFAGFSGGRKSILPGIAAAKTVLANHCAKFIASPHARTGNLVQNPLHEDMLFAARQAGLAFILNVALGAEGQIVRAFAGDPYEAHLQGCRWVGQKAIVKRQTADIVITSNGGYPLDQNIYQAVKGMTAGEACVREGGVVIMVAACEDGHGGEAFYNWFAEAASPSEVTNKIKQIAQMDTLPDQWEAQILARILEHCHVILVSDRCDPKMISAMYLEQAPDLSTALKMARSRVGEDSKIIVIPNGVSVIIND